MDPITIINEKHRGAVEICILIEAGQAGDESVTTDEAQLHENMCVNYTKLVCDIPAYHFESASVRGAMLHKLKEGGDQHSVAKHCGGNKRKLEGMSVLLLQICPVLQISIPYQAVTLCVMRGRK